MVSEGRSFRRPSREMGPSSQDPVGHGPSHQLHRRAHVVLVRPGVAVSDHARQLPEPGPAGPQRIQRADTARWRLFATPRIRQAAGRSTSPVGQRRRHVGARGKRGGVGLAREDRTAGSFKRVAQSGCQARWPTSRPTGAEGEAEDQSHPSYGGPTACRARFCVRRCFGSTGSRSVAPRSLNVFFYGNIFFEPLAIEDGRNLITFAQQDPVVAAGFCWPEDRQVLPREDLAGLQAGGQGTPGGVRRGSELPRHVPQPATTVSQRLPVRAGPMSWDIPKDSCVVVRTFCGSAREAHMVERKLMRQFFFLSMLIVGVLAAVAYLVWSVITTLYRDWQMGKDVDKIKAESETRRSQRQEEAARRAGQRVRAQFWRGVCRLPARCVLQVRTCPRSARRTVRPCVAAGQRGGPVQLL